MVVNTVSVDNDICVRLQREHPRHALHLVTIEWVNIPHDLKIYSRIEQLKTTTAKISLYDLISTSETHREILYVLFKKDRVPTNMFVAIFLKKLKSIKECDAISFCKYEKLNKELLDECLAFYITPMIYGW